MGKAVPRLAIPVITLLLFPLAALSPGCDHTLSEPPEPLAGPAADLGAEFDPASAGTLRGRVTWEGPIPQVPPIVTRPCAIAMEGLRERLGRENPNAPDIDPHSRAVRGAVVYLRGVDPRRSRPWDLPPVRVELRDRRLHVVQGEFDSHVGFVRRGDGVEFVSREALFHSLHARGSAFFGLALPDAGELLTRRLDANGLVDLSSGAGYYWMRGYLFVDDHPYYKRTDRHGRFQLEQVPPGRYDVVCWLPDWREARHERDPDTCLISRLIFRPPAERVKAVELQPGQSGTINFEVSEQALRP